MRAIAAALVLSVLSAGAAAAADDPFVWRVEQRFRLWDGADASALEALLDRLSGPESAEALHDRVAAFVRARPDLPGRAHWDARAEQYDPAWLYPATYRVSLRLAAPPAGLCRWSASAGRLSQASAPCGEPLTLELPARAGGGGSVAAMVTATPVAGKGVSAPIEVRDRLVAALGDSFGSGEGNPDRPADFSNLAAGLNGRWRDDWAGGRWMGRAAAVQGFAPAAWWDARCHRSFLNLQLVAALKTAADRPHEATTFVSYACSGAAVFDGVLTVQAAPVGERDGDSPPLRRPQVEALVANLCPPDAAGRSTAVAGPHARYAGREPGPNGALKPRTWTAETAACAGDRPRRKVDLLLVSVGGNDVGFTPVIFDGLLPRQVGDPGGKVVLAGLRSVLALPAGTGNAYVNYLLPDALAALDGRLTQALPERPQVLHTLYPSPLRSETGELCGPADETRGEGASHPHQGRFAATAGVWPDRAVRPQNRWRMSLDQADGRAVEQSLVGPLNEALTRFDAQAGWTSVDGYLGAFARRGWCASDGADQADLPDWTTAGWSGWNPGQWDPYARRLRLFRTPDDAALTQAPDRPRRTAGLAAPVLEPVFSERQEGLLASLTGAFHPTFEGHAIMGLELARAMAATPASPTSR